jgi:hypothetical protein
MVRWRRFQKATRFANFNLAPSVGPNLKSVHMAMTRHYGTRGGSDGIENSTNEFLSPRCLIGSRRYRSGYCNKARSISNYDFKLTFRMLFTGKFTTIILQNKFAGAVPFSKLLTSDVFAEIAVSSAVSPLR